MKPNVRHAFFVLLIFLGGCLSLPVPERLRTQILQPEDTVLLASEDPALAIDVNVHRSDTILRLESMQLYSVTTGEPWVLALFENSYLDSKAIHGDVDGETVRHTVITALPAGTYQIRKLVLKGRVLTQMTGMVGTNDIVQSMEHELDAPINFAVKESESLQYLGYINLYLISPSVESSQRGFGSSLPGYEAATQTIDGALIVRVDPPKSGSVASIQERYPATASRTFEIGKMWIEE